MDCPKCGCGWVPEGAHSCPECETAILTAPRPAAQIEVTQEVGTVEGGQLVGVDLGEVLGDVSIGNYTLRIGTLNGGVVNIAPPQPQQQLPKARLAPVRLLPRKSPGLLDRKQETSTATTTLLYGSPAEFHGPSGIGKTKLLRHLAHEQFDSTCPDGVVFLSAIHHKPVEDVLIDLFDAFYERESTYKPTAVQVRHSLHDKQALIILDDIDLERDEVAALMDAAPSCTFLLASTECCLWGEGKALALRGLPLQDALSLIERELGRTLKADEHPGAEALCTALEGHPLRLQQVAALVREDERSLVDLGSQLRQEKLAPPVKALTEQVLAACSEQERQILAVLAVSRKASLGREHVSALAGIEEIDPPIESLKRRKLAQSHSPRYSLTGSLGSTLEEEWDLTSWNERALDHFAAWAEQHRQDPQHVAEETDAILGILRWAVQEGGWEGALRLGRAVEGALAVVGQWGAWAQVLSWQFQAARELGDEVAQAWALHQSGTRGLCLEHPATAQTDLSEALRIRESLGDWAGAAVSRHNLEVFFGGPGGTSGPESNGNGSGGGGGWLPRLPLWLTIAFVVGVLLLGLGGGVVFGAAPPLGSNNPLEFALQSALNPEASPTTPSSEPNAEGNLGVFGALPKGNLEQPLRVVGALKDYALGNSTTINPGGGSSSDGSDTKSGGSGTEVGEGQSGGRGAGGTETGDSGGAGTGSRDTSSDSAKTDHTGTGSGSLPSKPDPEGHKDSTPSKPDPGRTSDSPTVPTPPPERTVPELTAPELTAPTPPPERTVPETTAPETTAPTPPPERTVPETTAPELTVPTPPPERTVPETTAPETTVPTPPPERTVPETTAPETTVPTPQPPPGGETTDYGGCACPGGGSNGPVVR